jgi:hypothetical protein
MKNNLSIYHWTAILSVFYRLLGEGYAFYIFRCCQPMCCVECASFAGNVAVADSQSAIMATEVAKKTFEKLNADMKPQRDRLEQLRKDIAGN